MDILAILKELFAGVISMISVDGLKTLAMFVIAGVLIYLAIKKDYEPALLLPIGFGAILANLPDAVVLGEDGFLKVLFNAGIANELFPILIFIGVGAMIDFSPLLKDPSMIFFGAAAQFGIFATFLVSLVLIPIVLPATAGDENLILRLASAIGIIGAADGPTTLYVANHFKLVEYMAPISVAAYSYMSLVPVIQPPVIKALTTKKERMIRMNYNEERASKLALILFPIIVTAIAGIIVPEGFLETMGTPDAVQVQIIYRDADTFEEHIVNDLLYAMSNLLGTAQCSVLTAGEYAKEMGFDDSQAYAVEGAVTNNSFSYSNNISILQFNIFFFYCI